MRPDEEIDHSKWGIENSLIALPISPKYCLLWGTAEKAEARVGRTWVDYVNMHTAFYADRFVFANIQSQDIDGLVKYWMAESARSGEGILAEKTGSQAK